MLSNMLAISKAQYCITRPSTAIAFSLRLFLHYKATRVGGVKLVYCMSNPPNIFGESMGNEKNKPMLKLKQADMLILI